jgi:hypothetical protein
MQKRNGVTIAHDLETAFVGPSTHCFLDFGDVPGSVEFLKRSALPTLSR